MIGGQSRTSTFSAKKKDTPLPKMKVPDYKWCEEDTLFEHSIRNKDLWVDSLFIFAIIWTFGSVMTDETKPLFDFWLKKQF